MMDTLILNKVHEVGWCVHHPHVHEDLISTCIFVYQYQHVHFEILQVAQ